eukprot:2298722-Rhodomonas_salina.7
MAIWRLVPGRLLTCTAAFKLWPVVQVASAARASLSADTGTNFETRPLSGWTRRVFKSTFKFNLKFRGPGLPVSLGFTESRVKYTPSQAQAGKFQAKARAS